MELLHYCGGPTPLIPLPGCPHLSPAHGQATRSGISETQSPEIQVCVTYPEEGHVRWGQFFSPSLSALSIGE